MLFLLVVIVVPSCSSLIDHVIPPVAASPSPPTANSMHCRSAKMPGKRISQPNFLVHTRQGDRKSPKIFK